MPVGTAAAILQQCQLAQLLPDHNNASWHSCCQITTMPVGTAAARSQQCQLTQLLPDHNNAN